MCLVVSESFEVSDMAAVFTSGLKVIISEPFFFFLDELSKAEYKPESHELHDPSERLHA